MEFTPLFSIFLHLYGVILCLWPRWVILDHSTLALSCVLWFGGAYSLLQIHISKVSLLPLKFMLDPHNISVCCAKKGDVLEFNFFLDVFVEKTTILEYHMPLKILDTQVRV